MINKININIYDLNNEKFSFPIIFLFTYNSNINEFN